MTAGQLNRLRDSGKRVTVTIRDIERSFRLKSVIHEDGRVFPFYTDYAAWQVAPDTHVEVER